MGKSRKVLAAAQEKHVNGRAGSSETDNRRQNFRKEGDVQCINSEILDAQKHTRTLSASARKRARSSDVERPESSNSFRSKGAMGEADLVLARAEGRAAFPGPDVSRNSHASGVQRMTKALQEMKQGPSLISDAICIGGNEDAFNAQQLKLMGVTHILNTAVQIPNYHAKEFVYLKVDLIDHPDQKLEPFKDAVLKFLSHSDEIGGRTLVHCVAGCSRSVSFVLMHLICNKGWWLKDAWDHVLLHRPQAYPNEGFRYELAMLEVKVHNKSSVNQLRGEEWNFYAWNVIKRSFPSHAVVESSGCCILS